VAKLLTTGDVAKVAGVSVRLVHKWIDSGILRGYRLPGSRFRRIEPASLVLFLKQHGLAEAEERLRKWASIESRISDPESQSSPRSPG